MGSGALGSGAVGVWAAARRGRVGSGTPWACGQRHGAWRHLSDHVQHVGHLGLDLIDGAVDVRVVLLKATHAREAGQRARELVPMEHAKVRIAHRQLAVGSLLRLEHDAVAGAVHRLEPKLLILDVEREHVLLVLGRVTRLLPQLEVVHVGRHHLRAAGRVRRAVRGVKGSRVRRVKRGGLEKKCRLVKRVHA
eukprot:3313590-Prymnesium_polylepis.1